VDLAGFVRQQCISLKCGIYFYVPMHVDVHARADKQREVWCPGCGRPFVWRESEADKERKRAEKAERELATAEARNERHNATIARLLKKISYWRGMTTRWKNRSRR
jgi:uncharacterized Zn finger protein (UPF0148 family)